MNVEDFKRAYENLRSARSASPRRVFIRREEADYLAKQEAIRELVGMDEKTGDYIIDGVKLEVIDYMVDPIYMFW
jgi:hypothetical protein